MKANRNDLINGLDYYDEYIENKNDLIKAFDEKIKTVSLTLNNKEKNKYNYTLNINKYRFNYFEGIGCEQLTHDNLGKKIISAIDCLIKDYSYSNYDLDEFSNDMGYKPSEAIKILREIKKNSVKIISIFGDELPTLESNLSL